MVPDRLGGPSPVSQVAAAGLGQPPWQQGWRDSRKSSGEGAEHESVWISLMDS